MSAPAPTATRRLGTRRSALAVAQAQLVAAALADGGREVELVGVTTDGDRSTAPLAEAGGVGVFVTELRSRLLSGEVDVVVHSLKDLPTSPAHGLTVAAIPRRADARDVLVARGNLPLSRLPVRATVGTGSPRRAAQLLAVRADLEIRPIRGNVDTRLGKVAAGDFDAIVVAAAGLARLGRLGEATQFFGLDLMLPAPGQGALAVECRAGDVEAGGALHELMAGLDDAASRAAVTAERSLLAQLEAGCAAPLGAFGEVDADLNLHLVAVVVSVDGATVIRRSAQGPASDAEGIGRRLAAELLAGGAGSIVGEPTVVSASSSGTHDRTGRR